MISDSIKKLTEITQSSDAFMKILRVARELDLPDWYVAGGAPRNLVWEYLFGNNNPKPWNDIDLVYFDDSDLSEESELKYQKELQKICPEEDWDVVNQARVHIWKKEDPTQLKSATDGISRWLETATCIGVRLEKDNSLTFTLPVGADDLLHGIIRHNSNNTDFENYALKLEERSWIKKWPKLKIV